MHRATGKTSLRKFAFRLPLMLAVTAVGASTSGGALELDRWKHPQARYGVGQFHGAPLRSNPTERGLANPNERGIGGPNAIVPNAGELNTRAATLALPEQRREGSVPQTEGRPLEFNRANSNPAGPNELQRLEGNQAGRGPNELQRQAGPNEREPFQRGQFDQRGTARPSTFSRQALAGHTGPGAGNFSRNSLPQRLEQRGNFGGNAAGLIARRPLIGERGFTGVPPAGETRFITNEMVFHVPPNVTPQQVDTVARRLGLSTVASQSFNLSGGTLFRFRINDGRPVADVIRALESENIGVAQPNYVFKLQQNSTLAARTSQGDPTQYVVDKLRLVDVHRIAIGSDVTVAVIDSEIDARNPELAGAVVDEFDAVGNHDKPHMHGTGMAGAIAAHRRLIGIAPGVRILAIHAFSSSGSESAQATSDHILMGIDWAIQKGAKIINMSFAGPDDPMMQLALQKAHDKGVLLIAAAGNMGPKSPPLYPAADPNVIAVTATDVKDQLLPQANQGSYIAVAAPGVDILEPAPNNTYQVTTGTSVAAAHVTGIAALLLDRDPTLDAAAIRDILTSTAKHHTPKARDDQFGWGEVDPYQALLSLDAKVARDRSRDTATDGSANPRPVSVR
jgi:subtilisin family serine protease